MDPMADDESPPAPRRGISLGPSIDKRPLYRVVEFMRDDRGRLREEGRIWHSDLHRVRQFGRAVAGNTAGSRVVIADNAGRVVEELPLPGLPGVDPCSTGRWDGWSERRLPSLPPAAGRVPLKKPSNTTPAAQWVLPVAGPSPAPARVPTLPAPPPPSDAPAPVDPPSHAASRGGPPVDVPTLGEDDTAEFANFV